RGIDLGHDNTRLAAAWRERQAKPRLVAGLFRLILGVGASLTHVRQLAERQAERLFRAAADDAELDGRAGRHAADLAGKVASVRHRTVVHGGDDVARLDPGLDRRTILLRLRGRRAPRGLLPPGGGSLAR